MNSFAVTEDRRELGCGVFDVVVVGAGPAGSMAALECARAGMSVLLVDRSRHPRAKVCGCCLTPGSLDALTAALGCAEVDALGGLPLRRVRLAAWGRRLELPLARAMVLSRARLDSVLLERARDAGARILFPATASPGAVTAEWREVRLRHEGSSMRVRGRVVLAADGLSGGFLRACRKQALAQVGGASQAVAKGESAAERPALGHVGAALILPSTQANPDYAPGVVYMAAGSGGYVGVVRLEDGRLNIAASLSSDALRPEAQVGERRRPKLEGVVAGILAAAGLPPIGFDRVGAHADGRANSRPAAVVESMTAEQPSTDEAGPPLRHWMATPRLRTRPGHLMAPRVLAIGDAAGFWEPFTGEGIAWALNSGREAAAAVPGLIPQWRAGEVEAWEQGFRARLRRRQRHSQRVAALAGRPRLAAAAMTLLSAWPHSLHWLLPGQQLTGRRASGSARSERVNA